MNDERRKRIKLISDGLSDLKAQLEEIRDEEQEAFDNLPDSLQGGSNGQAMEQAASDLDEGVDALDEAMGFLSGHTEKPQ